jgi:hypothetical protein
MRPMRTMLTLLLFAALTPIACQDSPSETPETTVHAGTYVWDVCYFGFHPGPNEASIWSSYGNTGNCKKINVYNQANHWVLVSSVPPELQPIRSIEINFPTGGYGVAYQRTDFNRVCFPWNPSQCVTCTDPLSCNSNIVYNSGATTWSWGNAGSFKFVANP